MAGSNNFKVFDENSQNIMSDVDYNSNTARQNGVSTGIASSQLHNKLFKQTSIMAAALGEVIKNKGYAASDTDFAALVQALQDTFLVPSYPNLRTLAANYSLATNVYGRLVFENAMGDNYDTHTMVDNGEIVCKKSGKYRIHIDTTWSSANSNKFGYIYLYMFKNTTDPENLITEKIAANNSISTRPIGLEYQTSIALDVGDKILFEVFQDTQAGMYVSGITICIECFELI